MRLSQQDKLRTMLSYVASKATGTTYKDLATVLGVSTRTLRRFKNETGHRLSARTLEKIKQPLDRENKNFRRFIKDKALVVEKARVRGKVRTTYKWEKNTGFRLPNLPVQPIPRIYRSRPKESFGKIVVSQTIKIDCALWSTQQKIDYLVSAANSGRFSSWTARVKVPVGVATSGDIESTEINEGDRAIHYMIGPFALQANSNRGAYGVRKKIENEIAYHEDAGRIVVSISIVENLPENNS